MTPTDRDSHEGHDDHPAEDMIDGLPDRNSTPTNNGQPPPVSTRVYARQGPTMTSHSSFLSPYLGSESLSAQASSSNSYDPNHTVKKSGSGSTPTSPVASTSNPERTSPTKNIRQRPPNLTSRSTMMRRRAALEDLCLGVEGVPMHREMLNDFTSVVKRVFGTKMSMVSIMRDEVEMIGMRGENPIDSKFSSENSVCPKIINSITPRPITYRDLDQTEGQIRQMSLWKRLVCPDSVKRRGLKGGPDDDENGDDDGKEECRLRFYAAVPLVIRWSGGEPDFDETDSEDTPLGQEQQYASSPADSPSLASPTSPHSSHPRSTSSSSESPRRIYKPSSSRDRQFPQDLVTLGTLCILDTEPRPDFSAGEEETLRQLGDLLVRLICTEQSEGWAMREVGGYKVIIDFLHRTALSDQMTFVTEHAESEPTGKLVDRSQQRSNSSIPQTPGSENGSSRGANDIGFMVIPDDGEEKRSESELYDDAICSICDVIEDCAVVLLDVSQYRIFLKREAGAKDDLHDALVDQDEPFLNSGYDIRPLANLMPGALQEASTRDLVVKRIRRKRENGQSVGPRRLAAKVADIAFHSPFNQDEEVFSEGVAKLLRRMLLSDQYWYNERGDSDSDEPQILAEVAPGAQWILALPVWQSDGSPFKVLVIAWDHQPPRKDETERFVRGIVAGVSAAMTIRKARMLEKAQSTFSKVQAHELRTPIHQIKNIATLLRSALTDGTSRASMLTAIKDIEVASQRLEMVTNNILSYFEVQGDGGESKESLTAIAQRDLERENNSRTLEVMLADLVEALVSTDTNSRLQEEETPPEIEIIMEIVPPFLGETVEEDRNGNLARAMGNIISNALAYIDQPKGFVHIIVDDVPSLLPPSGYADLSLTKNVSIQIQDSGIGMDREYLEYHYFRPMKKENALKPGSGLSVHIAQRLVNTLGGNIAVSSQSGMGTTVHIEVPLMRRRMTHAITANIKPRDPDHVASNIEENQPCKSVYLSGFFDNDRGLGLKNAGEALGRSVQRLGCKVVKDTAEADIILRNVSIGGKLDFGRIHDQSPKGEIVLLFGGEDGRQQVEAFANERNLRFFKRPIIPSVLRDVLFREKEQIARRRKIRDGQDPKSPGIKEPKKQPSMSSEKRPALKHRASPPVQMGATSPILVVEDNPINRKILVQYLKKNWPVHQAVDGEQAIDVFRQETGPCVVLLDINMPKLNGFETSIQMRRIEKEQGRQPSQIVAVTALSSEEHRTRGLNDCGMDEWLVKPTNRQQIIDAVHVAQKAIAKRLAGGSDHA